ncbi:MAG: DegT/DnrJ/EryC1/StrS family aminotransferase, partial [Candidatus Kariarchaeaceae archaeon]
HGAKIHGKHVGGFGDVATFSLYVTKNLISGEGGVLTTDDDTLAEQIISLKNHGRTPKGGYEHIQTGYNFRMTDIVGAIADVQMDKLAGLLKARSRTADKYRKIIEEIPNIDFQHVPQGFEHGNYIFAIDTRLHQVKPKQAIEALKERGIQARPIYHTLSYQQISFQSIQNWRWSRFVDYPDYKSSSCQLAEAIATNHFEIPIVPSLTSDEIDRVAQSLTDIFQ